MEDLKRENEALRKEVEDYRTRLEKMIAPRQRTDVGQKAAIPKISDEDEHVSIVVVGASGDLAKKKTFPSLLALYGLGLLPPVFTIVGYARTNMTDDQFRKHISQNFKEFKDKWEDFLKHCFYHCGQYDSAEDFAVLDENLKKRKGDKKDCRLFYFAIPPSVFVEVSRAVGKSGMSHNGWNRIVVEKPFGRDFDSSAELSKQLACIFSEDQLFRIDHYLGKEMVQNLMNLRFANMVFEPVWNRHYISSVQIVFKEDIGTEGRGGYFDNFGIIRDVMQNHLLQIMALVAMEPPVALLAEDIRDEKVKALRACPPIKLEDLVIGQYGRDKEGKQEAYLDDPTVPKGSLVPTFASAVLFVENSRWSGVPFILKCGKGLNERKADIRIQFKDLPNKLYKAERNELVLRVQPNEAVYLKFNTKSPGMSENLTTTELDLSYKERFGNRVPDAYERLIYDVLRGDHNLFVRSDELQAAWKIFTPILHQTEREKIKPIIYPFGTRGPEEADELTKRYGYQRSTTYKWHKA